MSSVKNYDPYNFFYISEKSRLDNMNGGCQALYEEEGIQEQCNSNNVEDDSVIEKCYNLRLCENRDLAEQFRYIKEKNNTSVQKYRDTTNEYSEEIINTVNLSIGILFLSGVIIKNYFK